MRDTVYQIKTVIYPRDDKETFTYDAMGNRLTRVFNGSTTSYTYNAGERMTVAGGVTYTYDDNGSLTARGSDTFGWDHENHLTSTTIDSVSSTYRYNGDGLRMSRTIGGTTVDYVWDLSGGLPNVLEDSQGNRYVYGLSRIARINGTTEEYYVADGLGSTTALTDDTGSVSDTYEYDVFGNIRAETGTSSNEFTYTGEQNESTGLEYLRARYYDPVVGRFLSEDPLPLLQRYAYVGNNPANYVDPSGLCHRELGYDQVCRLVHDIVNKEGGNFENLEPELVLAQPPTPTPFGPMPVYIPVLTQEPIPRNESPMAIPPAVPVYTPPCSWVPTCVLPVPTLGEGFSAECRASVVGAGSLWSLALYLAAAEDPLSAYAVAIGAAEQTASAVVDCAISYDY